MANKINHYTAGKGKGAAKAIHAEVPGGKHIVVGLGNIRVMIVPDEQFWYAQGLEINYGAQGDTKEEAQQNFQDGLLATVCLHLKVHGNIEALLRFAPKKILQQAAKNKGSIKKFAQVSLHEIADAPIQNGLPFDGIDYRVLEHAA
jgi:hypothetical protein